MTTETVAIRVKVDSTVLDDVLDWTRNHLNDNDLGQDFQDELLEAVTDGWHFKRGTPIIKDGVYFENLILTPSAECRALITQCGWRAK